MNSLPSVLRLREGEPATALFCALPGRPLPSHPRLPARPLRSPARPSALGPAPPPSRQAQARSAKALGRLLPLPGRASARRSGGRWQLSVQAGASHLQLQPSTASDPGEALFSFQKILHSTRHIESSDTCMKH